MEAAEGFASGTANAGDSLRKSYHPLIEQIFHSSQPVIAAVNGVAAGIGMSISLTTDIRLASDKASFFTRLQQDWTGSRRGGKLDLTSPDRLSTRHSNRHDL